MSEKTQNIELSIKDNLIRLLIIGFMVFLFILFFQPFPLELLEYNDRLLYVTGFGIMSFFIASICYVVLPRFFSKFSDFSDWDTSPSLIISSLFFIINATAYAFYIRYVGLASLSIYIIFKIVLVSLFPVVLMVLLIKFRSQQKMIDNLQLRLRNYLSRLEEQQKEGQEREITLPVGNRSEDLKVRLKDILFIQSANNYISISYIIEEKPQKKIIRNTLKNIESHLKNQTILIRCHRTTIVNILHIDSLVRSYSGYNIKLKNVDELLPVSRQYLMSVRNALSSM